MVNRFDHCQFLLSSHFNFTMTHFADHSQGFRHDAVNRLLRRDKLTERILREHVQHNIVLSPPGCLVFDESVMNKEHSLTIEPVRLQYSGNEHGLIRSLAWSIAFTSIPIRVSTGSWITASSTLRAMAD